MNIIITGASRGIGYELARQFCMQKGNHVIGLARNIKAIQELSESLTVGKNESILYPLECDLGNPGFETVMRDYVLNRFNKIDILINNAGTLVNKPIEQLTESDFDLLFNINAKAPFLIIKTLLAYFGKSSHIINISSMGGFQGSKKYPGLSLYSASKGALSIMTECFAEEINERGIRINCLALGSVQTEMLQLAFPDFTANTSAEEMARYIVNFSTDNKSDKSGQIVPVYNSTP